MFDPPSVDVRLLSSQSSLVEVTGELESADRRSWRSFIFTQHIRWVRDVDETIIPSGPFAYVQRSRNQRRSNPDNVTACDTGKYMFRSIPVCESKENPFIGPYLTDPVYHLNIEKFTRQRVSSTWWNVRVVVRYSQGQRETLVWKYRIGEINRTIP